MKNTKLIQLYSSLQKQEVKSLKKWLQYALPEGSRAMDLFEYLEKFYPGFEKLPESTERIFSALYPGKNFQQSSFRNLVSDLLNSMEEHLIWTNLKQKGVVQNHLLLEEYYRRDLEDLFQMRLKSSKTVLSSSKESYLFRSFHGFLLEEREYTYVHFKTSSAKQKTFKTFPTDKILKSLNRMYIARYLFYYAIALDNERMFGRDSMLHSAESKQVLELAQAYKNDDVFIKTRLLLIELLQGETKDTFPELIKLLDSPEFKAQHTDEKKDVIAAIYNYVQKLYVKGDEWRLPQLLKLLDFSLENKAPFLNSRISDGFFWNYVFFNLTANQVNKVVKFIADYKKMLQSSTAESTLNYSLAHLEFHKKNYEKVLQNLEAVSTANPQRFLGIKNLALKVYFETKEFDKIDSVVDSIRHKLINEEFFSKENIQAQKNFIKFLIQLVGLETLAKKTGALGELLKKLKKTEFVNQKEWLLAKITEKR